MIDTEVIEDLIRSEGLHDGSAELSRKQAVRLTADWIRRRIPAAIVRFGEGEGRLLVADAGDPESIRIAANKIRRQTGLRLSPDQVLKIKSLVTEAFDEADVVGLRGSASFNDEHRMWVERITGVFEERLANGRKPAYITHCMFNNALRDSLDLLLQDQPAISVISSRDVKTRLQADYGVPDVRVFQVPSQYITRNVDDEYESPLHCVPIWPDVYERLYAELTVRRRGEVFLVGAGLFGKSLCIRVRELGGIALDLGSCLDGLANKVTRGLNRPAPYSPKSSS